MINKIVRLVACAGTLFLVFKFINAERANATVQNLLAINGIVWLSLLSLSVFIFLILAQLFRTSMKVIDVNLTFNVSFNYTSMNTFFNTLLPMKGGLWIRGVYLNKNHAVPWKSYLFVVITSQIAQLCLLTLIVTATLLANQFGISALNKYMKEPNLNLVAVSFITLASLALYAHKTKAGSKLLSQLKNGIGLWVGKPSLVVNFFSLAVILNVVTCLRLWLAFLAVGLTLSISDITIIYGVLAIGLSWAFTPGNIGVKEAATVLVCSLFGIDINTALAASILDRAASMAVVMTLGGVSAYHSSKATS